MNNKGEVLSGIALGFWAMAALNVAISQMPMVKTDYQIKKSTQLCVERGHGDLGTCKIIAETMSKGQRINYMRDTQARRRTDHKDLMNISEIKHL